MNDDESALESEQHYENQKEKSNIMSSDYELDEDTKKDFLSPIKEESSDSSSSSSDSDSSSSSKNV